MNPSLLAVNALKRFGMMLSASREIDLHKNSGRLFNAVGHFASWLQ
jgi:type III secretory pathway component EscV